MATLAGITIPAPAALDIYFPITPEPPYGMAIAPDVYVHQFLGDDAKLEQRFIAGDGLTRYVVKRSRLSRAELRLLLDFWSDAQGGYASFLYRAPNDDGNGTTDVRVRFQDPALSYDRLTDAVSSVGVTLVQVPTVVPAYDLVATETRLPSVALQTALNSDLQTIIPLVRIVPLAPLGGSAPPEMLVSDRELTLGGTAYHARLLDWDGIAQSIGSTGADQATFKFGNADGVMSQIVNTINLHRARIEFSLYHVGTKTKLDLWAGQVDDWSYVAGGNEFDLVAVDQFAELLLMYPARSISRTCWKPFAIAPACPYVGALADCDHSYNGANGCQAHGMDRYFGGHYAAPQGVVLPNRGVSGILPVASVIADSAYGQPVREIYTDVPMDVPCDLIAGRDEAEFYDALGVVGEGPITLASDGHKLDGQPHHGPGALGLRIVNGDDPAGAAEYFSLGRVGNNPSPTEATNGTSCWEKIYAAGTAFLELRRTDEEGIQLTALSTHKLTAVVNTGLSGWIWTAPGARTWGTLTNPVWVAVNALLRARGLRTVDTASAPSITACEALFDVSAAVAAAAICDATVDVLIGSGSEKQFRFVGTIAEERTLRDWITDVLQNCLGYWWNSFGKLKIGVRNNATSTQEFGPGNVILGSLQIRPLAPAFNSITANFGDEEFEFASNSVKLDDYDDAAAQGAPEAPVYQKSQMQLCGTSTKSQAARIITTRLREELGGTTAAERIAARQVAWKTTIISLAVEPGSVVRIADAEIPGGRARFRVTAWKLNRDYSIELTGRTVTDSMYDLTAAGITDPVLGIAPVVSATAPANGTVGIAGSWQFRAAGSLPMTWTRTAGMLPAGLTLAASGLLSGTPTTAGSYTFTLQAENPYGTDTQEFTLVIGADMAAAPVAPTGTAVSVTSDASGYRLAVTWTPPSPVGSVVSYELQARYYSDAGCTTPVTDWSPLGLVSGGSTAAGAFGPFAKPAAAQYVKVQVRALNGSGAASSWAVSAAAGSVPAAEATGSAQGLIKLAGDLGGSADLPRVVGIQGVAVDATTVGSPTDGHVITYDSASGLYKAKAPSGGTPTLPLTTKGDLLGYDTAPARVPVGTDGYALVADSTAAAGLSFSPISNIGLPPWLMKSPDSPRSSPSAYDDEFLVDGTLDPKWSQVNNDVTGQTLVISDSLLQMFYPSHAGDHAWLLLQNAPAFGAGTWTLVGKLLPSAVPAGNYCGGGLVLKASSGRLITFGYVLDSTVNTGWGWTLSIDKWNNPGSYAAKYYRGGIPTPVAAPYLYITYDGSNLKFGVSNHGGLPIYIKLDSGNRYVGATDWLADLQSFGVRLDSAGGPDTRLTVDFFRKVAVM